MKSLPQTFFQKPTVWVARNLLGKAIVRYLPAQARLRRQVGRRDKEIRAVICETEAYVGSKDKACHASRGRTPRTEIMFREAGHAYVYLIYGMHWCFNVVTEKENFPSAVLIRGICTSEGEYINGPGRVCKYLHIDKKLNGKDLITSKTELSLIETTPDGSAILNPARRALRDIGAESRANGSSVSVQDLKIKNGPRIGVDYAGSWAKKPWRFWIDGTC